jgi:hypothetical protein
MPPRSGDGYLYSVPAIILFIGVFLWRAGAAKAAGA